MQPGSPHQAPPYGQQPSTGNPAGAVFLAFFASVVVSLIYTGVVFAMYKAQSSAVPWWLLYILHGLLNGVVVGALAGLVGRGSNGARVGAAVIAPLGVFFGYANILPLLFADSSGFESVRFMLENDPFFPARSWWNMTTDRPLVSLLGIGVAAVAAWGLAYAVGRRGRRS